MASAIPIRPSELVRPNDSSEVLRLFAETLKLAENAMAGKPRAFLPPPGPFWLLANRSPSLADIKRFCDGEAPPGWPPWFERNAGAIHHNALQEPFLHCVRAASQSQIDSGQDVCRVMAAVAQTLFSTNVAIVQRNRRVAGLPVPARIVAVPWTEQEAFISVRPDEQGGCVAVDHLAAWMASHIGPAYADKIENQDAVYALPCGKSLAFALADGVGTSLGSRFAAAFAAYRFCHALRDLERKTPWNCDSLTEAVRITQEGMDRLLDRLLADPVGAAMTDVMGTSRMQGRTAQAILENTRTAEKPSLPPALATTLIGGWIQPSSGAGQFTATFFCIGDGVVEKIAADGNVHPLIVTDPEQMAISASMAPGPLARDHVRSGAVVPHSIELHEGDHLLVSSDGLARGHSQAVWNKIQEMEGDIRPRLQRGTQNAIADVLRDVSKRACELQNAGRLFDDNVSLIVVSAGRSW